METLSNYEAELQKSIACNKNVYFSSGNSFLGMFKVVSPWRKFQKVFFSQIYMMIYLYY